MKVDAALLCDPVRLADAIVALTRVFDILGEALEPVREAARAIEWHLDWYRDPASAWWER